MIQGLIFFLLMLLFIFFFVHHIQHVPVHLAYILWELCCQIQHFQKAVIRRKYRLAFSHFPELAVESFNGICGINQPSYCLRIFEISGQGCPIIML